MIFYVLYIVYLLALFVDWEFILNSDYAIWGALLILLTLIFITCVIATLYISGYQVLGLSAVNGLYLTLILVGLLVIFGIILYYQYYTTNKLKATIMTKLGRREFIPLNYQYGRDSNEIGLRLQVTDAEMMPLGEPTSLQEVWSQLMANPTRANAIIKKILGTELHDSIDVCYDLLWYFCLSENPFRTGLNNRETSYIVESNVPELRELLGPHYVGASNRASLIFAILSGQVIPETKPGPRYEDVKAYNPRIVYNLAFIQHQIINHTQGTYSVHGPYTYLALQAASPIETIIANVDVECRSVRETYDRLVERLGIGRVAGVETMAEDDRISHLQGELSLYHNVFTRGDNFGRPPPLPGLNRDQLNTILSYYTNVELIETYEPRSPWTSRAQLMSRICDDVLGNAKWSLHSVQHCNNDDTININTGDPHSESDKHDPQDPTLSYGVHRNYKCYQASELEACFREYDGIFLFRVPDWRPGATDPNTQAPVASEFTLDCVKQLDVLLKRERIRYNVEGLIAKIQTGLDYLKSAAMQTRHLKQALSEFTFEQRQVVELYLSWMFAYSMWMRFWRGPGSLWPLVRVNVTREADRNRGQRASPPERDEHIFIQEGVRTAIIEMYERDPILKNWVESLPTIYYDFETREASCATHSIKSILDQIAIGDYCMGFGSDTILKTAYYYITAVLEYPLESQGHALFDGFMERMLPQLQDIEYTTVTNQVANIHSPSFRLQVLNNRLHALQQPIPKQPAFSPSNYQNNVHIE
jgi:hypothetical protein